MIWDTLQFRANVSVIGLECWTECCVAGFMHEPVVALCFAAATMVWMLAVMAIMFFAERGRTESD